MSRQAFEDVDRAGRHVESVVTAKGDLTQFRQAVTDFSSALDAIKQQPLSSHDQAIAGQYDAVRQSLDDIRLVWEAREARQQELLPLADPLPARLQQSYGLPVNTNEPPSIYATEARQMIWNEAKKKLAAIDLD